MKKACIAGFILLQIVNGFTFCGFIHEMGRPGPAIWKIALAVFIIVGGIFPGWFFAFEMANAIGRRNEILETLREPWKHEHLKGN